MEIKLKSKSMERKRANEKGLEFKRNFMLICLMFLFILIFIIQFVSSYTRFQTQNYISDPFRGVTGVGGLTTGASFDDSFCSQGSDFVLQIAPASCNPTVVRSDLLEEQNVPVFCPIMATKINPLIDVNAIDTISFSGNYPSEVSGVGFYPAQAAVGGRITPTNDLITENIGYAVIVLRQNPSEDDMSDFVEGTLTARLKYDVQNAFGVGQANFLLPVMSEIEWNENFISYGFWDGRAYVRAEEVGGNSARILVYRGKENIQTSFTLEKGQTSGVIYIPGFYCLAGLQVKLSDVVNPDTTARLKIDGDVAEVSRGEMFLENRCRVTNILSEGSNQEISFTCKTDENRNERYTLEIKPRISLKVNNGNAIELESGEKVNYDFARNRNVYYIRNGVEGEGNERQIAYYFLETERDFGNELTASQMNSLNQAISGNQQNNFPFEFSGFGAIYRIVGSATIEAEEIKIQGNANPIDAEVNQKFFNYFENSLNDYETLREQFIAENKTNPDGTPVSGTYAEDGLFEAIILAHDTGQKATMLDLVQEFKELYPNSPYVAQVNSYLDGESLSSSEIALQEVEINSRFRLIVFEGVRKPSFEEYGARISINGVEYFLSRDDVIRPFQNENDFIELEELDREFAIIEISSTSANQRQTTSRQRIELNRQETIQGNTIRILEINLEKVAKVEIIPNVKNARSEADFNFNIGIEKRAIDLSPEKIKEKISNLEKNLKRWEDISSKLGTAVESLKAACLSVGTVLTAKNLFSNLNGKAIARQSVMQGEGGWNQWCESNSDDIEQCLLAHSAEINVDVEARYNALQQVNNQIKEIDNRHVDSTSFGSRIIDADAVREEYIPIVAQEIYNSQSAASVIGIERSLEDITASLQNARLETLREIHEDILALRENDFSSSSPVRQGTQERLGTTLQGIMESGERTIERRNLENTGGFTGVTTSIFNLQNSQGVYGGGTTTGSFGGIQENTATQIIEFPGTGNRYVATLDFDVGSASRGSFYAVNGVYSSNGIKLASRDPGQDVEYFPAISNQVKEEVDNVFDMTFNVINQASCENNGYENPQVRYNGNRPAIVPFDLQNGWYAATRSFDDSEAVSSFYVCNVGANSREEFNSGFGDDICQQVNLFTGQSDISISCVQNQEQARNLVREAQLAIEDASRGYDSGVTAVNVRGNRIEVGDPTSDFSGIRCTDFMSPSDCKLLFNVCDPVICPSSRCDLGGSYRVDDVIQSGIIGSIALCLPNAQEGIVVPICLSGVKAGVDGYLSVMQSYQSCLQENLETGATVGICDEIHSIYMCEFFWRQAIPFTKLIIPTILKFTTGQLLHGGGEYLGVATAWQNTEQSVNYFTQYYGANSFQAFKARTTDEVGTDICRAFVSARYPVSGEFFDALLEPDSPPQYYGRFDEIPFTSATVPSTSQYKVFYHIFAGNDRGVTYQVYLRSPGGVSLYQSNPVRQVDRGFIPRGEFATETIDFVSTSGYQELCISVNAHEECGFKQVTTSFAIDYVEDLYEKEQAAVRDITSERACVSGTNSAFTLLSPNLQEGVDETINPEIYNRGIIRVCATENPGMSTDPNWNNPGQARWIDAGYCGNQNIRCWLDTRSVRNVIQDTDLESQALEASSQETLAALLESDKYLNDGEFRNLIEELDSLITRGVVPTTQNNKGENDLLSGVETIDRNYVKLFFTSQKAEITWFRARILNVLARIVDKSEMPVPEVLTDVELEEATVVNGLESAPFDTEEVIGSCSEYSSRKDCYLHLNCRWRIGILGIGGSCVGISNEEAQERIIDLPDNNFDTGKMVSVEEENIVEIVFKSQDGKNKETHQLYIIEITSNKVIGVIKSNGGIDFELKDGARQAFDINSDGIDDMFIEVSNVRRGNADISLRRLSDLNLPNINQGTSNEIDFSEFEDATTHYEGWQLDFEDLYVTLDDSDGRNHEEDSTNLLLEFSRDRNLNFVLLKSLIMRESSWNPGTTNDNGDSIDWGLMQVNDAENGPLQDTGPGGVCHDFCPDVSQEIISGEFYKTNNRANVQIGTCYLKCLRDYYFEVYGIEDNSKILVAAYNAGPNAVNSCNGLSSDVCISRLSSGVQTHVASIENYYDSVIMQT